MKPNRPLTDVRGSVVMVAILAALAGCHQREAPVASGAAAPAANVRVVEVRAEPFVAATPITGSLISRAVVEVKAETTGRLVRFDKEEGDAVRAGETVIWVDEEKPRLAVREAESAVQVAEAALELARVLESHHASELERAQNLIASGGITDRDLKAARLAAQDARAQVSLAAAQLAQTKAALASARQRLAECEVKAPVAGEIYKKLVNKGAYVEPATPVFTLVDNTRLELESNVAASELGALRAGQAVRFNVSSHAGENFTGRVVEISQAVDVDSRSAKVRIQVNNPGGRLSAGMFAQGEILTGMERQAVLIPLSAVYRDDSAAKESYVFVVDGNKARRRGVRIGREVEQQLEIVAGLKPGDKLVPERSIELADGVPVKVN